MILGQLLDGRYQIIRVLGAGGFGQTYIAQDTRIPGNFTCVVKHLKPASNDPRILETARRLFKSEGETLARLGSHDQIPRLLAYFEENQEFYLVQEFIAGHSLSAELSPGQRWAESQVIDLLQAILSILEFIHHQGVIHRDIKPDNIIRRQPDNKLVLIDFGAIKQVQTQMGTLQGQASATVAIGTPGYMPTEQGRGQPRPNSDIYSLGIIGIQALTGLMPTQLQEDVNTGEILWQHLVAVSPGLAAVLTKMTRYHFKDRYQTATEALQALQQINHPWMPVQPAANPSYTPTASGTTGGYTPTQPSAPPQPSWQPTTPVAPTHRYAEPVEQFVSQPASPSSPRLLPLFVGAGVTAVVGFAVAALMSPNFLQIINGNKNGNGNNISSTAEICTVAIDELNVRSGPAGNVINTVKQGTSVSLTGNKEDFWVEISAPLSGWVGTRDKQGTYLINCPSDPQTDTQAQVPAATSKTDSSSNSSSGSAKNTRRDKGASILLQARDKYQSGDLEGAIALLKTIPASSAVSLKVEKAIAQWSQEWNSAKAVVDEAQKAFDQGNWDEVIKYTPDTLSNRYWSEKLANLIKQAKEKKAESQPDTTPTVSPSPTDSPTPTVSPSPTESPKPVENY